MAYTSVCTLRQTYKHLSVTWENLESIIKLHVKLNYFKKVDQINADGIHWFLIHAHTSAVFKYGLL